MAQGLGLPKTVGALVAKVGPGSPAAQAGFEAGDVILSIKGQEVRRMHDLPRIVAEMPIGQTVAVTVWRRRTALSLRPVIGEMPTNPAIAALGVGEGGSRVSDGGRGSSAGSRQLPSHLTGRRFDGPPAL